MNAVDITKDLENATLVVTSVFAASPARVWRLWADPRQLERWWGPDPYPATVVDHDLRPGGHVSYYMTGPEGDQHKGYWRVTQVDPPSRLVFEDGFADGGGHPCRGRTDRRAAGRGVNLARSSSGPCVT